MLVAVIAIIAVLVVLACVAAIVIVRGHIDLANNWTADPNPQPEVEGSDPEPEVEALASGPGEPILTIKGPPEAFEDIKVVDLVRCPPEWNCGEVCIPAEAEEAQAIFEAVVEDPGDGIEKEGIEVALGEEAEIYATGGIVENPPVIDDDSPPPLVLPLRARTEQTEVADPPPVEVEVVTEALPSEALVIEVETPPHSPRRTSTPVPPRKQPTPRSKNPEPPPENGWKKWNAGTRWNG